MLKKIDKLVLKAFMGRFVLTLGIVLFILLTQYTIKNFKYFVGKDLGFDIFAEFFIFFGLVMMPIALPLAVLLASLMTFGTLGEHSELTAIKSSGVSLLRIIRPVAIIIIVVTGLALVYNDTVLPRANLKGYSLIYDIRQKKPTLDIKEGIFYNGIEGYSIKVDTKHKDEKTLEGVIIYDHSKGRGNNEMILAERGEMEFIENEEYLQLKLFNGNLYSDTDAQDDANPSKKTDDFLRYKFDTARLLFSLESFRMGETKEELFMGHNLMKTAKVIKTEKDSLTKAHEDFREKLAINVRSQFYYSYMNEMINRGDTGNTVIKPITLPLTDEQRQEVQANLGELPPNTYSTAVSALNKARSVYGVLKTNTNSVRNHDRLRATYQIDLLKKYTQALAVLTMFLIGAPLGAIIKRGGLGVPVIVSVAFFVIYYVSTIAGEKFAKEIIIYPEYGAWAPNLILLLFGIFFMKKAYEDARLFDPDYYVVMFNNLKQKLGFKTSVRA